MNRFFQTISQYIFFQHHTYVSELYFFKGDSSLQCTTVALRRKISANICLLSFLAWSMVARKQKQNFFFKKKVQKQQKKMELAGERYPASHFTVVVGVSRQNVYSKKNLKQKGKIHQQTTTTLGQKLPKKLECNRVFTY